MAKRVAFYLRVSKDDQTAENQLLELRAVAERRDWEVVGIYRDDALSGTKGRDKRPDFDRLLKDATRRKFDLVASWAVDRLGRSLQDLVNFLCELQGAGVDLYLHQQALDTSTPSGRALYGVAGVFAEWEIGMIRERIHAGLARAKAQGRTGGRPKVPQETEAAVRASLLQGVGIIKTAKKLGIGVSTVQRIKQELAAV